ncbi:MAG: hypothetical protein GY778_17810 [bacterium]|nr:hypothetical protein [bacterium]
MLTRIHLSAFLAVLLLAGAAGAQLLDEDFEGVAGTPAGPFFSGPGYFDVDNWDDNLTGEAAFAGTEGNSRFGAVSALGISGGGAVGDAGRIEVTGVTFDLLNEDFELVSGVGGGTFLTGDGTPDTLGFTLNWDDNIGGEAAFAGTKGGAAVLAGGGATAEGITSGGFGGSKAGQITMSNVNVGAGNWFAGLEWEMSQFPGATPLFNPGFDDAGGSLNLWEVWGNTFSVPDWDVPVTALSAPNVLKMWGNWTGSYNESGVYQELAAQPNQVWELQASAQHVSIDALTGTANYVNMSIEYYDAGGTILDSLAVAILDATYATDVWHPAAPLTLTAPAGTVAVRAAIIFVQPTGLQPGAGVVDDVRFRLIGGPHPVTLSDYALTAQVLGTANGGAGETPGDYQLRVEDLDGNRLVFSRTANGVDWQEIGGALNLATEADATGAPASGVFDANSPSFRVVVAFDDESTNQWGTGGTLVVDDLLLPSMNSAGSDWVAGLSWPGLSPAAAPVLDLSKLYVAADVSGSVPGGAYDLRVECFTVTPAGLNEGFDSVNEDCGAGGDCFLLTPMETPSAGNYFDFSTDWETTIQGEGAYGGLANAQCFAPGGISAQAVASEGFGAPGAGEIRVENVGWGVGGGWYAGLDWGDQGLASTDPAQVTLEAYVRGIGYAGLNPGDYELRIEDANGDRMYYSETANGGWQYVGGPLTAFQEGPDLSGGGDGTFDWDSSTYTVVVSFMNETATWQFGGTLQVDDLYLTPVDVKTEIGRVTFPGAATAGRAFEKIGGMLSGVANTFGGLVEAFNDATGTGGGEFYASGGSVIFGGQPWDDGLVDEEVFAGTWGSGALATVDAWACTDCGTDGSAGNVSVTGAAGGGSGGWWAGLSWPVAPPDWADLGQVMLTANVKASKLAPFQLRIEDPSVDVNNPVWLTFVHTPTTTDFEPVGGALSGATEGCPNAPCAPFNYNAPLYKATLVFEGNTWATDWGTEGSLTIDNIFFSGLEIGASDEIAVTLAFVDEVATWGTDGSLTVDNLILVPAANADGDSDVDLVDAGAFQRCYGDAGAGVPVGCEYADLDNDADLDGDDIDLFFVAFEGPL